MADKDKKNKGKPSSGKELLKVKKQIKDRERDLLKLAD